MTPPEKAMSAMTKERIVELRGWYQLGDCTHSLAEAVPECLDAIEALQTQVEELTRERDALIYEGMTEFGFEP